MEGITRRPIECSMNSAAVLAGWIRARGRGCAYQTTLLKGRNEEEQREVVAIYAELLSEHSALEQLDAACRQQVTQGARFSRSLPDVRSVIEHADAKILEIDADQAWQRALRVAGDGSRI